MVNIKNLEKRNDIPISNKYELINESTDDFHYVIYYLDKYIFKVIVRRLDAECGWGVNLKIKLFSKNNNNNQIISIGSSEKNCKIIDITSKIELFRVKYVEQLIPKIIIQTTYSNDIQNVLHYNSISTFIELNPEYEYLIFDNNDSRLFIKNNFDDNTLMAYDLIISGAFKADFFRYCIIYIKGGCYFDCKSILRLPLRNIINRNDKFLICKDIQEAYYNAVILSIPNNELLLKTINMCIDNIYNFHNKFNLKKSLYDNPHTMFSFTGPVLFYNSTKDLVNNNNISFLHKIDHNRKNHYNHEYLRLFVEYNSKHIITKQFKTYSSSSGTHYSTQWLNREVIYELCCICDQNKICLHISNKVDKFNFYVFSEKILIVERIDSNSGWGDFLKIKVINENTNKELILNIGSSEHKYKIITLDNNFFYFDNQIKYFSCENKIFEKEINISICHDKYNINKLIIINNNNNNKNNNNDNNKWIKDNNLNVVLYNNKIYNFNIDNFNNYIKIIDI